MFSFRNKSIILCYQYFYLRFLLHRRRNIGGRRNSLPSPPNNLPILTCNCLSLRGHKQLPNIIISKILPRSLRLIKTFKLDLKFSGSRQFAQILTTFSFLLASWLLSPCMYVYVCINVYMYHFSEKLAFQAFPIIPIFYPKF